MKRGAIQSQADREKRQQKETETAPPPAVSIAVSPLCLVSPSLFPDCTLAMIPTFHTELHP
jgi:hypothetical protein